jgi:hypothetical protein
LRPVTHRRHGAVIFAIQRPGDDRWSIFAGRAPLAFSSAWSGFADGATVSSAAEKLPTIIAGVAWIIAEGDETRAVKRDECRNRAYFSCRSNAPRKFGSRASQPLRPARATQIQSVPPGIWAVPRFLVEGAVARTLSGSWFCPDRLSLVCALWPA